MKPSKVEVSESQEADFIELLRKHGRTPALLRGILMKWTEARIAEGSDRLDVGIFVLSIVRRINEEGDRSTALQEIRRWKHLIEPLVEVMKDVAEQMFTIMDYRNHQAHDLEKAGHADEAIVLYEMNVSEGCRGAYPYERLRSIYTARHDYANAIRVCEAAVRARAPIDRTYLARLRLLYKDTEH